ncbi:MAG: hypothetical protein JJT81_19390 [Rubellimicrobium sp.]|nr:hypothetical protein [Rubellimicrobium sp.]
MRGTDEAGGALFGCVVSLRVMSLDVSRADQPLQRNRGRAAGRLRGVAFDDLPVGSGCEINLNRDDHRNDGLELAL